MSTSKSTDIDDDLDGIEIEYVSAEYNSSVLDHFKEIFEKFSKPEELTANKVGNLDGTTGSEDTMNPKDAAKSEVQALDEPKKISKKKKKLASRLR